MVRVKEPGPGGGRVFVLIGVAGLYFGRELAFGTAARMGPGYFPTLLSIDPGDRDHRRNSRIDHRGPPIEPVQLRPIAMIVAAILIFGVLIEIVGLVLTALLLTVFAAYARREVKLAETILLGAGLAAFTVVVFVYLLGQPLPAWWGR